MYSMSHGIPDGVQVEVNGKEVVITGSGGENRRNFKAKHVRIRKEDNTVTVYTESVKKSDRADVGTVMGHIRNMMEGIEKGVTYKLKVVYSHFPMTVRLDGGMISVENFLGEKKPREIRTIDGVEVQINGQDITLRGINKERVGLCASQIEQICRLSGRDRRVFQDGIYIVEKNGKRLR